MIYSDVKKMFSLYIHKTIFFLAAQNYLLPQEKHYFALKKKYCGEKKIMLSLGLHQETFFFFF